MSHPEPDLDGAARLGSVATGPFHQRWRELGPADGPLVLLLHGIYAGASSYEWRRLVPELRAAHRVRVPDLLGFGLSDRPDLEWTPAILTAAVEALVDQARADDPDVLLVASSLTGAHLVRAVGERGGRVALITPTGLGKALGGPSGALGRTLYGVGRHTPIGDAFVHLLSSGPSVRWFQTHQTYRDPGALTDDEVDETRRVARLPNAKHAQLAFVANRLALPLDLGEVRALAPRVLWGSGQRFASDEDADRWIAAGADVQVVADGLPQVESPADTARWLLVER